MNQDEPGAIEAMEALFEHIIDEGVGVILDTGSFDALHARLRELMRSLAQGIIGEAGEHADDSEIDRVARAIATCAALDLWNHTPIPENHFRPRKIARPERNSSCPCGSGRKFKQCCGVVAAPSLTLPPEDMVRRVLEHLPRERVGKAWASGAPPLVLGAVAQEWSSQGRNEDVIMLLEPVFADVHRLDERAELAAAVLEHAYAECGDAARWQRFVEVLQHAPDQVLRAAGFRAEAMARTAGGDWAAASRALERAQQLTPGHPALAPIEVVLLCGEGREAEARARVASWTDRLERDPDQDHSELIAQLHDLVRARKADERLAALPSDYASRRLVLHVELGGISPPIWRRLEVENTLTFADLHVILQTAMGWENQHLYEFIVGKQRVGPTAAAEASWGAPMLPADEVEIGQLLGRRKSFRYVYDFGDDWSHRITVEQQLPSTPHVRPAAVLAGKRACPPEDCGGVPGYYRVLDALAHPDDEESGDTLAWVGEYKPEAFSVVAVRKAVASLFAPV